MPTNRRKRRVTRRHELTEVEWLCFMGRYEEAQLINPFTALELEYFRREDEIAESWKENRHAILEEYTHETPGSRPPIWWKFDAPRQPMGRWKDCYFDGELPEPLKRLGGTGVTPWDAGLAVVPSYDRGMPNYWESFDEDDPPVFESEAAYLLRHELLTADERKRLPKDAFEPVTAPTPAFVYGLRKTTA